MCPRCKDASGIYMYEFCVHADNILNVMFPEKISQVRAFGGKLHLCYGLLASSLSILCFLYDLLADVNKKL